jgi:hypothetical protein
MRYFFGRVAEAVLGAWRVATAVGRGDQEILQIHTERRALLSRCQRITTWLIILNSMHKEACAEMGWKVVVEAFFGESPPWGNGHIHSGKGQRAKNRVFTLSATFPFFRAYAPRRAAYCTCLPLHLCSACALIVHLSVRFLRFCFRQPDLVVFVVAARAPSRSIAFSLIFPRASAAAPDSSAASVRSASE